MSNNIYDPSDIENNINGFNIIECSTFQPVELYISIPNLGYGFIANVMNSFSEKYSRLYPGINFSITRNDFMQEDTDKENDKFVPVGSGITSDFMVIKIPGNNLSSTDFSMSSLLLLPIPLKVRNTLISTPDVLKSEVLKDRNLACYSMMGHIIAEEHGNKRRSWDDLAEFMIASESIRSMAAIGLDDHGSDDYKFTGSIGDSESRVEFAHLNATGSNREKYYFDIVRTSGLTEYAECFLKPAVYAAFEISSGKKRLYYSEALTRSILPTIKITGKKFPPKVNISTGTSFLGVPATENANILPNTEINIVPSGNVSAFTGFGAYDYILKGSISGKESAYGANSSNPISDFQVFSPGNTNEETVTASLYTPVPPLFTIGDAYSDNPNGTDERIYIPFSQAYVLPFGSYSRAASTGIESCQFCGKTGKVGLSSCPICRGSGSIRCSRCIENTENTSPGVYSLKPGYLSEDCPVCNSSTSPEYEWKQFVSYGLMTPEVGYMPCECAKRAIQSYLQFANPGGGQTTAIEVFNTIVGHPISGTGYCSVCNGRGMVPCSGCSDPLYEHPRAGLRRSKCGRCNDSDSDDYLGLDTPNPGYLKCTEEAINSSSENANLYTKYSIHIGKGTPPCNGTGNTSQDSCPACNGSLSSYRFRSIDLDTTVDQADFEGDNGTQYTVSSSMTENTTITKNGTTFEITGLPSVINVPIELTESDTSNISVYFQIPATSMTSLPADSRWKSDTMNGFEGDELPFKWLPPEYYDVVNGQLTLYMDFPDGSVIKVYQFATHTLPGTTESQGYILLNSRSEYPAITANTVYESTWCYFATPNGVPLYSGIGVISPALSQGLFYKQKSEDGMAMFNNGFSHLIHATSRYMTLIENQKTKAIPYLATSGYNGEITAGYKSRFICIDKNNLKMSEFLSFNNIEDYSVIPNHMKISNPDIEKAINEMTSPVVRPFTTITSGYTEDIDSQVSTVYGSLSEFKYVKSVEVNNANIYPYVSKSTANYILSNSDSAPLEAVKGYTAGSISDSDLPDDVSISNSIALVGGTNNVRITDSSYMNITEMIESKITTNDTNIYLSLSNLLLYSENIARSINDLITEVLIKGNLADNGSVTLVSPAALFSNEYIEFLNYDQSMGNIISRLQNLFHSNNPDENTRYIQFVDALNILKTGESGDTPLGFESNVNEMAKILYLKTMSYSLLISTLHKVMPDGSTIFLARLTNTNLEETMGSIKFTEEAAHKGLLVYNLRKTYMLIISSISLLCAVLERMTMIIYSIINGISPESSKLETGNMNLLIHGFSTDSKICFPEVTEDIDLTTDLITQQASLNRITKFLDSGIITYDLEMQIPENSISDGYTVPIMGMPIPDSMAALLGNDENHKYGFGKDETFIKDAASTTRHTELVDNWQTHELADPESYRDVKTGISSVDYMIYSGTGIKYFSGQNVISTQVTNDNLESVLKNSNQQTIPKITPLKVNGKIDMGYIFPYLSPGAKYNIPPVEFNNQSIDFAESHPRTVLSSIKSSYAENNPAIPGGNIGVLFNNYETQKEIIKQGVENIKTFIENPYVLHRLYDSFKNNANHQYGIYFIGSSSTTLEHESRHGESALMYKTLLASGVSGLSEYTDDAIADEMYDSANANWKSHTKTDDDIPINGDEAIRNTAVKDRNFNLWLSKRMAYNTFIMYMSFFKYQEDMKAQLTPQQKSALLLEDLTTGAFYNKSTQYVTPDWSRKITYNMSLIYSDSKEALNLQANEVAFQPFHCYGFGSLLQVTNKQDFDLSPDRKSRRDAQRLVHVMGSADINGATTQMYSISHLKYPRSIPLGSDLDSQNATYPAPSGNFNGSWYNPTIEKTESTDWYTNVTAMDSFSGASLNNRTKNHMKLMIAQFKNTGYSGSSRGSIVSNANTDADIATIEEFFTKDKDKANTIISDFMKTTNGIRSFSVPRNEANLTSKIWLKITEIPNS